MESCLASDHEMSKTHVMYQLRLNSANLKNIYNTSPRICVPVSTEEQKMHFSFILD